MKTYKIMIVHSNSYEDYQKARELKLELESEPIPKPTNIRAQEYIKNHPNWIPYEAVEVIMATDVGEHYFCGMRVQQLYVSEAVGIESMNIKKLFMPMLTAIDSEKPILF